MYLTLRTGCERHGRKNPLPFPYFRAVTCRQSAPDYPRERQEFKEEGKPQVSLPFCPCGGRRSLLRSAERNSPLRFSKKLPPVRGEPAYAVRVPRSAGAEKTAARQGRTACAVRVPRSAGAEELPPVRGEPPAQFACPGQPVLKKLPPVRGEPPAQFGCTARSVQDNR